MAGDKNAGNVVGLIKSSAAPTKTYVIWAHILDPAFPDIVELLAYNANTLAWEPLGGDVTSTIGDMGYRNTSNVLDRLPVGGSNELVLKVKTSGGHRIPQWSQAAYNFAEVGYVTTGGNDAVAQLGRIDLPFGSLGAAMTAASTIPGSTRNIYVMDDFQPLSGPYDIVKDTSIHFLGNNPNLLAVQPVFIIHTGVTLRLFGHGNDMGVSTVQSSTTNPMFQGPGGGQLAHLHIYGFRKIYYKGNLCNNINTIRIDEVDSVQNTGTTAAICLLMDSGQNFASIVLKNIRYFDLGTGMFNGYQHSFTSKFIFDNVYMQGGATTDLGGVEGLIFVRAATVGLVATFKNCFLVQLTSAKVVISITRTTDAGATPSIVLKNTLLENTSTPPVKLTNEDAGGISIKVLIGIFGTYGIAVPVSGSFTVTGTNINIVASGSLSSFHQIL